MQERAVLRPGVSGEALAEPQGGVQWEEEGGRGEGEGRRQDHRNHRMIGLFPVKPTKSGPPIVNRKVIFNNLVWAGFWNLPNTPLLWQK